MIGKLYRFLNQRSSHRLFLQHEFEVAFGASMMRDLRSECTADVTYGMAAVERDYLNGAKNAC